MKKSMAVILMLVLCSGSITGCGGRVPSLSRSQKIVSKYFKKYGKKYEKTDFHAFKVEKVEINTIRELQKHLAEVDAYVTLTGGAVIYHVLFLTEKKTFGWRVIAWQNLGSAT